MASKVLGSFLHSIGSQIKKKIFLPQYVSSSQFDHICITKSSVGPSLFTPRRISDALKADRGKSRETIHIVIPYIISALEEYITEMAT